MSTRFVLAYSLDGKVYLKSWDGRVQAIAEGVAPAISPSHEQVAFLQQGDVFLYSARTTAVRRLTSIRTSFAQQSFFPLSIAWHPNERYLLFTRVEPYVHDRQKGYLIEYQSASPCADIVGIMTVWIAHLSSGRCWRMLAPLGDITALHRSDQLEGAGLYEPLFSPDGRWIWVLHEGNLYQAGFDARDGTTGTLRLAKRLGTGFDVESPGASKAGHGALMLAWDGKRQRLVYWKGRFWGTGVSEYGYLPWQHGRFNEPHKWQPLLAATIRQSGQENVSGCAVDREGRLWMKVVQGGGSYKWIRADGRDALPTGAERPSF